MITTLTGGNYFGLQQMLQARVQAFVADYGDLALERLDGDEADFTRLSEALTSLPFLASKKMVVLRTPSVNKQFAEKAEKLLEEIPETTDLILVEPKLDKRLGYYKLLKKSTDFQEFNQLDVTGLTAWLVKATKEQGATISSADARYLVERVGPNQQLLATELEKLLLHASHNGKPTGSKLTRQDIDLLTEPAPQSTIFELLEAAFAGNGRRTLALYQEQRALKVEPQQIIALLAWQLHILVLVKTAGERSADTIASEAKLNPYVVRKSQAITRSVSLTNLKSLIQNLLTIDVDSKRTNLDVDEALQHYLITIGT